MPLAPRPLELRDAPSFGRLHGALVLALALVGCSRSPSPPNPTGLASATVAQAAAVDPVPVSPPPPPEESECAEPGDVTIFASPRMPWKGAPLRIVAVSEKAMEGKLVLQAPGGAHDNAKTIVEAQRHGGPPYWWSVDVPKPAVGTWKVRLEPSEACEGKTSPFERTVRVRKGKVPAYPTHKGRKGTTNAAPSPTASSSVAAAPPSSSTSSPSPPPPPGTPPYPHPEAEHPVWRVRATWDRANENLFSAWIEKLFDAPLEEQPSWNALHEVLRDPRRNFLFDYLSVGEDQSGLVIRPDCADLPYFLRAYFAFKLGLPFGYSKCTRGGGGAPPSCPDWWSNVDTPSVNQGEDPTAAFGYFLRVTVADSVHSGSGRIPSSDDASDYYPVPLSAKTLRPGVIFADPYGHVLMIARRVPQTESRAGILLAVDGQPDGTVARKRFWRGNFLFAVDPALGDAGFKRFRPVVRAKGGGLRRLTNAEIAKNANYGDFSLEQYEGGVEGFYDKMEDVLSPAPLDPRRALLEKIDALEEQVKARVVSIENGRKFLASGKFAEMPDDASIFETTGPWEDYSTPSRDLRLLIAIDIVKDFPERIARRPTRYAMPPGKAPEEVKRDLEALLASELSSRRFTYTRTDGSPFSLSLADVVARASALEVAYNPNECVEMRWGATPGTEEASTCQQHAPPEQVEKMAAYRVWFRDRRRPPRP